MTPSPRLESGDSPDAGAGDVRVRTLGSEDFRTDPYEEHHAGRTLFNRGPMNLEWYVDRHWTRDRARPGLEKLVFGPLGVKPLLDVMWDVYEAVRDRLVEFHTRDSGVRVGYLTCIERADPWFGWPVFVFCEAGDYISQNGLNVAGTNLMHLRVLEGPRPRAWWDGDGYEDE